MSAVPGKVTRGETLPSDPTDNPTLEFRICVLRCVYFGLLVRFFPFFYFSFASTLGPTTVPDCYFYFTTVYWFSPLDDPNRRTSDDLLCRWDGKGTSGARCGPLVTFPTLRAVLSPCMIFCLDLVTFPRFFTLPPKATNRHPHSKAEPTPCHVARFE